MKCYINIYIWHRELYLYRDGHGSRLSQVGHAFFVQAMRSNEVIFGWNERPQEWETRSLSDFCPIWLLSYHVTMIDSGSTFEIIILLISFLNLNYFLKDSSFLEFLVSGPDLFVRLKRFDISLLTSTWPQFYFSMTFVDPKLTLL